MEVSSRSVSYTHLVVVTERECDRTDPVHDVKDKFVYLYLQSVAVAADNLVQGFGMQ